MLSVLFMIFMIWIFGKMVILAFKAAWSVTHVIGSLILLPIFLIGLVLAGLVKIALPILLIVGVIAWIHSAVD